MKRLLLTAFTLCTLALSPCLARAAAAAPPSAFSVTAARCADLPATPEPPDWPPRG